MTTKTWQETIAAGAGRRDALIRFLVLHTEGDGVNTDTSAATIRKYHMMPSARYETNADGKRTLVPGTGGNGWTDIGYNFWIRMNGLIELGRPLHLVPAGATGLNSPAIHIGCAGDGNIADFTMAQYDSLFELAWACQSRWPKITNDHVIGHREVLRFGAPDPRKTCPGRKVDMNGFRARLGEWR